jgi:hypothetical protein
MVLPQLKPLNPREKEAEYRGGTSWNPDTQKCNRKRYDMEPEIRNHIKSDTEKVSY